MASNFVRSTFFGVGPQIFFCDLLLYQQVINSNNGSNMAHLMVSRPPNGSHRIGYTVGGRVRPHVAPSQLVASLSRKLC